MLDMYRQSRGKGLTGLLRHRRPRLRRPRGICWLTLAGLLLALLLLTACTATPSTQVYWSQPVGVVITTDTALIERVCWNAERYGVGPILGCYVPVPIPMIYCPPDDAVVCQHEWFDHHVRGMRH